MPLLKAIRSALKMLSRNDRRGALCEPCGNCPACKGTDRAYEVLADALEHAALGNQLPVHAGARCRHCNEPLKGAVGNPDHVCPNCGRTARQPYQKPEPTEAPRPGR